MGKNVELAIVPSIGLSHIVPTVELAKRLIQHDNRVSATFLIIPSTRTPQAYIDSVTNSVPRLRFITLSPAELPPPGTEMGIPFLSIYIQNHQSLVKQALTQLISDSNSIHSSVRLVVDMFSTTMIDVATQLGIPSYVYFTSCAASLGLMLHLPTLDSEITTELKDYATELSVPFYINPVPIHALPSYILNKKGNGYAWCLSHARRIRETKGVIVNSISELESHSVEAFNRRDENYPRVYLVGPLLNLEGKVHSGSNRTEYDRIMKWLDDQPDSSVMFLCFGTRGAFGAEQVKEIANGLEQSGHRFLWSLRRPSTSMMELPSDYTNPEEVLPEGFLEKVKGRGLVCGWAPQVEVLAHKAIGGFTSHCGWNSILESLLFGVPILTWPLDAEQKVNAFQLVKDLGLAMEIKGFYKEEKKDNVVEAEDIERGLRCVMEDKSEVRRKVKEMSERCNKALVEGGSSWSTMGCLVEDLSTVEL